MKKKKNVAAREGQGNRFVKQLNILLSNPNLTKLANILAQHNTNNQESQLKSKKVDANYWTLASIMASVLLGIIVIVIYLLSTNHIISGEATVGLLGGLIGYLFGRNSKQ